MTPSDVPRLDAAHLEAERRRMPRAVFAREYLGEFAEPEDQYFADADIEAAVSPAVRPILLGASHAA